jgi:hypothetical protein
LRPDLEHLMLIGAYRDNEVAAAHPLMRKLDAIKAAGGERAVRFGFRPWTSPRRRRARRWV